MFFQALYTVSFRQGPPYCAIPTMKSSNIIFLSCLKKPIFFKNLTLVAK